MKQFGEIMSRWDLEVEELFKLDLETQGEIVRRYGDIVRDVNFEPNIRQTLIKYKDTYVLVTMKDGDTKSVVKV
jgi:hypothetical protein